ncbi:hypothetical protein MMC30_007604 [Trapelia coarctata]|nr:hypothetical protein [Trapelia coarctata]
MYEIANPENNVTFAIDLSKTWTTSNLDLVYTPRPPASLGLNDEVLWWDEKSNTIYCFGGERSATNWAVDAISTPPESIWGFTPDGHGSGTWTEVEIVGPSSNTPFPSYILRPAGGASTVVGRSAYYLGGDFPQLSSLEIDLPYAVMDVAPGLLTFNFDNLTVTNSSNVAKPYNTSDHWIPPGTGLQKWVPPGRMIALPSFGTSGIAVVIGGGDLSQADFLEAGGYFDNISIFDTYSQKWYHQTATGAIPEMRSAFCAVGVQDRDKGSFEIFIHGGIVDNKLDSRNAGADQIYILSLPAFQWVKRIGVFDMTALQWKDSYDSTAEAYTSPAVIKELYINKYTPVPCQIRNNNDPTIL